MGFSGQSKLDGTLRKKKVKSYRVITNWRDFTFSNNAELRIK